MESNVTYVRRDVELVEKLKLIFHQALDYEVTGVKNFNSSLFLLCRQINLKL